MSEHPNSHEWLAAFGPVFLLLAGGAEPGPEIEPNHGLQPEPVGGSRRRLCHRARLVEDNFLDAQVKAGLQAGRLAPPRWVGKVGGPKTLVHVDAINIIG